MKKVFSFKEILIFVIFVNLLILLKNIYIHGVDNIYFFYAKNIKEIIFQLLVSAVFGVLISIKKHRK